MISGRAIELRCRFAVAALACGASVSLAAQTPAVRCALDESTQAVPNPRAGMRASLGPGAAAEQVPFALSNVPPLLEPGTHECSIRWSNREAALDDGEGLTAEVETVLSRRREALALLPKAEPEQVRGNAALQFGLPAVTLGPVSLRGSLGAHLDLDRSSGDLPVDQREFGLSTTRSASWFTLLPAGAGWMTAQLSEHRMQLDSNTGGRTWSSVRSLVGSWGRGSGVNDCTSLAVALTEAAIDGALSSATRSLSATLTQTMPMPRRSSLRWSLQGARGEQSTAFRIGELHAASAGTWQRLQLRADWQQRWRGNEVHWTLLGQHQSRRFGPAALIRDTGTTGSAWALLGRIESSPTSPVRLSGSLSYAEHNVVTAQLRLAWKWP
jgi:hypothetical protein